MATLLDIKSFVENQKGSSDTSADTVRDNLVNFARRTYYSAYPWTFCRRSDAITITAQLGDFPATYNEKFPCRVYTYTETTKYDYAQVAWDEVDSYSTDSYVFAVDHENNQIKINQTTVSSVTADYQSLPTDGTTGTNSTIELAPDITAIGYLSLAHHWLGNERATGKFQMFKDLYDQQLARDRRIDMNREPIRDINFNPTPQGYNTRGSNQTNKGYVGRHG